MPASNYDPVSSALKNSFTKVGSVRRNIDEQMESSLQKSLLGEIKTNFHQYFNVSISLLYIQCNILLQNYSSKFKN